MRGIITYPKGLSDIRKTCPKVVSDFRTFKDIKIYRATCLYVRNVSDFLSQFLGYHISDIVSDIR